MILFGSYAKGHLRSDSDIDIAIISDGFSGSRSLDIEKISSICGKYISVEIHPISSGDTPEENPFLQEIVETGKEWSMNRPLVFN